jgi:hypothetical protein
MNASIIDRVACVGIDLLISSITRRRPEVAEPFEPAGFCWSGFLCLVLAVLQLALETHWS